MILKIPLVLYMMLTSVLAKPPNYRYKFTISKFDGSCNPRLCTIYTDFSETRANISVQYLKLMHKVSTSIQLNARMAPNAGDRRRPRPDHDNNFVNFLNQTYDLCQYIRHPNNFPVFNIIWSDFISSSSRATNLQVITECPIPPVSIYKKSRPYLKKKL